MARLGRCSLWIVATESEYAKFPLLELPCPSIREPIPVSLSLSRIFFVHRVLPSLGLSPTERSQPLSR